MPSFNNYFVLRVSKNVHAFLKIEMGFSGSSEPYPERVHQELRRVRERLQKRNRQVKRMRESLQEINQQHIQLRKRGLVTKSNGATAENVIWIFGTGRSGSTWLMNMMAHVPRTSSWNEPMVGKLFGDFYQNAQVGQRNARGFILGDPAREGWIQLIRKFVLGSISYRNPGFGPKNYLVVKEPNSSIGAPLIMASLPESRMILLIRDPRDVVASVLDAMRKGSWLYKRKNRGREGEDSLSDMDPDAAVERRAQIYYRDVSNARKAFDAHNGLKVLVRYEDLRESPLDTLKYIYSMLEIAVGENDLEESVNKYLWESIPEEDKGRGKKFRKAAPGSWHEDLTPGQVEMVEQITAPILKEFYSASISGSDAPSSSP